MDMNKKKAFTKNSKLRKRGQGKKVNESTPVKKTRPIITPDSGVIKISWDELLNMLKDHVMGKKHDFTKYPTNELKELHNP